MVAVKILAIWQGNMNFASCDLHNTLGLLYLAEDEESQTLYVNEVPWKSWHRHMWPNVRRVKWFNEGEAILWLVPSLAEPSGCAAAIVSRHDDKPFRTGMASDVFVASDYVFASYGEDVNLAATPGEYEYNLLSVFRKEGSFAFGLRELLDDFNFSGEFLEITHACVGRRGVLAFLCHDTPYIWLLDAAKKFLTLLPLESGLAGIKGISTSGDDTLLARKIDGHIVIDRHNVPGGDKIRSHLVDDKVIPREFDIDKCAFQGKDGGRFVLSSSGLIGVLDVDA